MNYAENGWKVMAGVGLIAGLINLLFTIWFAVSGKSFVGLLFPTLCGLMIWIWFLRRNKEPRR